MSKRTRIVVGLILGSFVLRGTHPTAARSPQSSPALERFGRGARLQPRLSGPVTVTLQGDSRQAFEKLAALGAVQVIFHPRFMPAPLRQETELTGKDFADALDRFAQVSGALWEVYDGRTILVANDDAGSRRQVEAQVLRPIALPPGFSAPKTTDLIAAIRLRAEFKQLAVNAAGDALLVRDTPENVARAEEVVAEAGGATPPDRTNANSSTVLTDLAGNVFTHDGTRLRKTLAPSHVRLSPPNTGQTGPMTIRVQGSSFDAFQVLADRAGVQVYFHRQFTERQIAEALTFEGIDFFSAMDLLCFSTGAFWIALDERAILVASENPTVRREVESMTTKAFNVKNLPRQQEITQTVTALRTLLTVNQIAFSTAQRVLLLRDTAEKIALAERIIAECDRGLGSAGARLSVIAGDPAFPSGVFAVPADSDQRRARLAQLQPKTPGPYTLRMNQPSRQSFETIAAATGIQVVFHRQFQTRPAVPFAIQRADLGAALDRLSLVTGSFWTVLDAHTILVAADNPTVRRDVEAMVIKTVEFRNLTRQQETTEAVTALRTILSFNQIAISTTPPAIVMRDNADKIALAERILTIFDRPQAGVATAAPGGPSIGPSIPSGVFAIPADTNAERETRKQLQVKAMPAAINFNQPSRQAFETLASMAGVHIAFDRQFAGGASAPFICEDCDCFSAMDRLSFETGSFWIVAGARSVIVAADTPAVRRDVEEMIVKTIYFSPGKTQPQVTEAVTALRTLLTFNQIGFSSQSKALVLRDTAGKIALAEKIMAVFDPQATFSAPISSGVSSNPVDRDARRTRFLAQLQLSSNGPISLALNQSSRDAYEKLAGMAGIRVEFHPQFANAVAFTFGVDGVDWITAMDTLAFQTGTFWIPQGPQTILVAPDNPATRRAVIPETTKTIEWKHIGAPTSMEEVTPALRTLIAVRDVQPAGANAITVTDLPDVVALAERIVASMDIDRRVTPDPRNSPTNSSSNSSTGVPAPVRDGATGSIAGQVRWNDGAPAAGVRVSAVPVPSGRVESVSASAETNASGSFKLDSVPTGRYALRIDSPRFPYPTYFPSGVSAQEGQIVTVGPGGAVEGLRLSTSDALPHSRFGCFERDASCFDFQRRFIVEGVMKEIFVQNPALKAVLTVRDDLGPRDLELLGPNVAVLAELTEKGFSEVKAGDRVKVVLSPRRDGGPGSFLTGFVKADGTEALFPEPARPTNAAGAMGETGETGEKIRINFQRTGTPAAAGYLVDGGAVFGDRGNGHRYGWTKENNGGQDRNASNAPDQRYDTLAHMQIAGDHVWELEVPNGFYSVRVVAGDANSFNSLFIFSVEGAIAIDNVPASNSRWLEDTVRVRVSDGRLTIANAVGACNNKLAFIEVTPAAAGPVAPSTPKPAPISTGPGPAENAPSLEGRGGVIAGAIRSLAGAPIGGVRVAAMSADGVAGTPTLVGIARTDAAGRYLLEDIPNGRYHVVAGSLTVPLFHPGVGSINGATVVTVSNKPVIGVNFSADRPRLELTCPDDTGPKR